MAATTIPNEPFVVGERIRVVLPSTLRKLSEPETYIGMITAHGYSPDQWFVKEADWGRVEIINEVYLERLA